MAMLGESGYERRELDAYFTPPWCVDALLTRVRIRPRVWEPACGDGAICKVLERRGYEVIATDIADHGYGEPGRDFLTEPTCNPETAIITNPPYTDAESFIRHALNLTAPPKFGQVAMLLRNEYDCAASRRDLWDFPFVTKIVLTKRPRWSAEDKASPRHNFAWYVWDWMSTGQRPTMEWAP